MISFKRSGYSAPSVATSSLCTILSAVERAALFGLLTAASKRGYTNSATLFFNSWSTGAGSKGRLARFTACISFSCILMISCRASCPNRTAPSISSSGSSFAPASTIITASVVPAMERSNRVWLNCDSSGLMTSWSLMYPTRTAPTGPAKGISDIHKAAEAPTMPRISESFSWSADSTVITICTSLRYPLGKRGRRGRSARRQARIACSEARPSRLINPPGILPAAYIRSSTSTVKGKKSMPSRGSLLPTTVASMTVSP